MVVMTSYRVTIATLTHQTLPKCVYGISVQLMKTAGEDKNALHIPHFAPTYVR